MDDDYTVPIRSSVKFYQAIPSNGHLTHVHKYFITTTRTRMTTVTTRISKKRVWTAEAGYVKGKQTDERTCHIESTDKTGYCMEKSDMDNNIH